MQANRRLRWARAAASWSLVLVIGGLAAYAVWTVSRANRFYEFLKDGGRGWTRRVFGPDPELGFAPVPDAVGADMLPGAPPVPTRFDQDGFRVPVSDGAPARQKPLILALGDSFTYGAACIAEVTYPYVVARALGGSALNAGAPSYGLAQMLILARRLIPRRAPDFVLVQYSSLLVARARSPYAQSYFGVLTAPSFVDDGSGLRLQPPPFDSRLLDLPLADFRNTPRGVLDYLSFLRRAALPLLLHDDVCLTLDEVKYRLGILPYPPPEPNLIVRAVYTEIAALCRASGARMLIVLLGPPPTAERRAELEKHGPVVDAELALCRVVDPGCLVPTVGEAYLRAYGHFYGSPPRLVDSHPNARAHALIADEIVKVARGDAAS